MSEEAVDRLHSGRAPRRSVVALLILLAGLVIGAVALFAVDRDEADPAPTPSAPLGPALATGTPAAANERWVQGSVSATHGVASGDVSSTSALVWARASGRARMSVDLATNARFRRARRHAAGVAGPANDYAVTFRLRRLRPATRYFYRVWFAELGRPRARSSPVAGTFRTAPPARQSNGVRFVFGGDMGSGDYCRHAEYGYPIFYYMSRVKPDFFVSLGDTIYGDQECGSTGPEGWRNLPGDFPEVDDPSVDWSDAARVQEIYFQHWRYTRGDRQMRDFLAKTPVYSLWDDHEVMNDFGASWTRSNSQYPERAGYRNLVAAGRRALFAYGVLGRRKDDPNRLYRSFRWGKDLHLLLTDSRSYRSRNEQQDTPDGRKTMLGGKQRAWLKGALVGSKATWKVVASSVPVSVPTGSEQFGRDGWADGETGNGFERELVDLLRHLDARNVRNVVFVTADLHFAQATRNVQDYDGDGDAFVFHELVAGPLNARTRAPYWLDRTTNPTSLYGEGDFFNFGHVLIRREKDGKAHLRVETRDSFGELRTASVVDLTPA